MTVKAEVITAAAMAIHRLGCAGDGVTGCLVGNTCDGKPHPFEVDAARAAAPAIAAAAREAGIAEGAARCADWLKSPAGTGAFRELIAAEFAKAVAAERDRIRAGLLDHVQFIDTHDGRHLEVVAYKAAADLVRKDQP